MKNFKRSKNEVNQDYMHENISWKKCSADTLNIYNYNLSTSVSEILNDKLNDVNNLYDELCNAIKSADVVLLRVKYRKHVKPLWNSTLKDLRKAVDTEGISKVPREHLLHAIQKSYMQI
jgi:hypothetical protein